MMKKATNPENKESGKAKIVINQIGNTSPELEVHLEKESIWLNQGAAICSFH